MNVVNTPPMDDIHWLGGFQKGATVARFGGFLGALLSIYKQHQTSKYIIYIYILLHRFGCCLDTIVVLHTPVGRLSSLDHIVRDSFHKTYNSSKRDTKPVRLAFRSTVERLAGPGHPLNILRRK